MENRPFTKSCDPPSPSLAKEGANLRVVCFLGSAGALTQLSEIFNDFVPPKDVAWVVANHGPASMVFETLAEVLSKKDSVSLIREGHVEPLVGQKVYIVDDQCAFLLNHEGALVGLPKEKKPTDEFGVPWFKNCAQALASGSPHPIRTVLLSSLEEHELSAQDLKWLHSLGTEFFTPLFTPYHKPGESVPYPHLGALTDLLVGGSLPYKSAALNELLPAITESIHGEIKANLNENLTEEVQATTRLAKQAIAELWIENEQKTHQNLVAPPGAKVVVAEDDEALRGLVLATLIKQGYRPFEAANGAEALEIAAREQPSLIITDWMMPVMDGLELIKAIRDFEKLKGIPVILLTANNSLESKLMGKGIGADGFLAKPFNHEELVCTARNLIALKDKERELKLALEQLRETTDRELKQTKLLSEYRQRAELGNLVASVVHEFSNPIMSVQMSLASMDAYAKKLEELVSGPRSHDLTAEQLRLKAADFLAPLSTCAKSAKVSCGQLQELSRSFRAQSRVESNVTLGVDLREVIDEAIILVGAKLKLHHVEITQGDTIPVTCFRSQIGQLVTKVLSNAADALTEKKKTPSLKAGENFKGKIVVKSGVAERDGRLGAFITVSDNGHGRPGAIREKISERFSTTKAAGAGTGAGLASCVEIIEAHGGCLEIGDDSNLGWARVEIWLPGDGEKNRSVNLFQFHKNK